jgi:hypothetical protein
MLVTTLRRLYATARDEVETRTGPATEAPDVEPRYGVSVSYAPCRDCGEGTMEYDPAADESRCTVCGTTTDD